MIRPEEFYDRELSAEDRNRLWNRISRSLPPGHRTPFLVIADARSFFYGVAATVLIGFAIAGGQQVIRSVQDGPETRLDRAYREAISKFEAVVPASAGESDRSGNGQLQAWKTQLGLVDRAVADLRRDIAQTGPSPVKQTKLRELYALKLQVLQTMIGNGGIDL